MPELPEVETTRRGIAPYLLDQRVKQVIVRQTSLRWPVPVDLSSLLARRKVKAVDRRGKYLLIQFSHGCVIIHLGMSGHLRILPTAEPPMAHDHVDIELSNGHVLRYTDPRRFGCMLWTQSDPLQHRLLIKLGPEPLSDGFNTKYLYERTRNRRVPIKTLIMNSHEVVGVGNIYANEALFQSGIHPLVQAGELSKPRLDKLVKAIKSVLAAAIQQGGTTLKDFYGVNGETGYFALKLSVYGRGGQACLVCKSLLEELRVAQRQTVFCPRCQS